MVDTSTEPSVVEILAARMRMSEGQLYTAVIMLTLALLLAVTTIPRAHKLQDLTSVPTTPPSPSPAATR